MGFQLSKQTTDACSIITTGKRLHSIMARLNDNTTAPSTLLGLPQELFLMVLDHLEVDRDFLMLRILSKRAKEMMCDSFRERFASRLAHVDGSLTRSHLATLLALVKEKDIATEIQTISISSATMSEAVLHWPEPPEAYKEKFRGLLEAEHMDLDEGIQTLSNIFAFIPSLPKLRRINTGAFLSTSRIDDTGDIHDLVSGQLMHHISAFVKYLGLDQKTPQAWQDDTVYTSIRRCVDEFSGLDRTIGTTLMALTNMYRIVKSRNIRVAATFKDIPLLEIWYRWASLDEVHWMQTQTVADDDPIYYNTNFPHKSKDSMKLLARMRGYSERSSGSPDTATRLVHEIGMWDQTSSPYALGGISALAKHLFYHADSTAALSVNNMMQKEELPRLPVNARILGNLMSLELRDIKFEGSVLQNILRSMTSLRRLSLVHVELTENSWKNVFMVIKGLEHVFKIMAKRLSVAYGVIDHEYEIDDIEDNYLTSVLVKGRVNVDIFLDAFLAEHDCIWWSSENKEDAVFFPKGNSWTEAPHG